MPAAFTARGRRRRETGCGDLVRRKQTPTTVEKQLCLMSVHTTFGWSFSNEWNRFEFCTESGSFATATSHTWTRKGWKVLHRRYDEKPLVYTFPPSLRRSRMKSDTVLLLFIFRFQREPVLHAAIKSGGYKSVANKTVNPGEINVKFAYNALFHPRLLSLGWAFLHGVDCFGRAELDDWKGLFQLERRKLALQFWVMSVSGRMNCDTLCLKRRSI